MKVPLLDLKGQYASIKEEIDLALAKVIRSQRFILGSVVEACEEAVARYSGCTHGIGVSSGTDALLVALMAEEIGPGAEVITTPYSFFATAGVVARLGATPVFVDIDPVTFNIDPGRIEEAISEKTRAIIPVHLFGQMAEMDPVMRIAERHDLVVIEDAAQAIGAQHEGRRAGSIGHYGCFSFFPTKNLGCFGDGGMVVTHDAERARKIRTLRVHGEGHRYIHETVGGNFRLDALQAAVLLAKLPHLDGWIRARRENARLYSRLLGDAGLADDPLVRLPLSVTGRHVFNQYVVRVPQRDFVQAHLRAAGVGTAIYYPLPLPLQACFSDFGYPRKAFPNSEDAARHALALPIYPELAQADIRYVARTLRAAITQARGEAGTPCQNAREADDTHAVPTPPEAEPDQVDFPTRSGNLVRDTVQ